MNTNYVLNGKGSALVGPATAITISQEEEVFTPARRVGGKDSATLSADKNAKFGISWPWPR